MKVIWLVISGLRADHLGAYGNSWLKLQNLDQFAKSGKVFTDAKSACADPMITRMEWLTGQSASRFDQPNDFYKKYPAHLTLPAQLAKNGFKTALLTDNYSMFSIYHQLNVFDALITVPGQGVSHNISENSEFDDGESQKRNELKISSNQSIPKNELIRYKHNRHDAQKLGRPEVRLFKSAAKYLDSLNEKDDAFIMIDAFALTPSWLAPDDFMKYRRESDRSTVAWPVAGKVDLNNSQLRDQINFYRRSYADQCQYIDSLIGNFAGSRLNHYFQNEQFRLILMSDQGVLIGDDNYLLQNPSQDHHAMTRQIMITLGHDIEENMKTDEPVSPVDLFATTLEKTGVQEIPPNNGKTIESL